MSMQQQKPFVEEVEEVEPSWQNKSLQDMEDGFQIYTEHLIGSTWGYQKL